MGSSVGVGSGIGVGSGVDVGGTGVTVGARVGCGVGVGALLTTGAAAAPPSPPGKIKNAMTTAIPMTADIATASFNLLDPPLLPGAAEVCPNWMGGVGGSAPAAAGRRGGLAGGGRVPPGGAGLTPGGGTAAAVVAPGGPGGAAGAAGAGDTGWSVAITLSTAPIHSRDSGLSFCSSPNARLNMSRKAASSSSQDDILGPRTVSKSAVAPSPMRARMFLLCCSRMA